MKFLLIAVLAAGSSPQNVLTWNASPTATSYNIWRSTTGCSDLSPAAFAQIATGITVLTYTDANITSGVVYSYYATASNSGGNSGPSNCVTMTVAPPAPPTGLTVQSQ